MKTEGGDFKTLKRWRVPGGFRFPVLVLLAMMACTNANQDGEPLGPSFSTLAIIPAAGKVAKAGTLTFTTRGGTAPFFWSISPSSAGTIAPGTGVFTASSTAGKATVTVVDSVGNTTTATVEVLADILTVTPGSAVVNAVGAVTFTPAGGTGAFVFSIKNVDPTSTFPLPTLAATATVATVTVSALPTPAAGNQTFTISVTDAGNGDVGAATLTLLVP